MKRLNLEWLFSIHYQPPVSHQLLLMQFSPCQNKFRLLSRKIPFKHFARTNVHCGFVFGMNLSS